MNLSPAADLGSGACGTKRRRRRNERWRRNVNDANEHFLGELVPAGKIVEDLRRPLAFDVLRCVALEGPDLADECFVRCIGQLSVVAECPDGQAAQAAVRKSAADLMRLVSERDAEV